MGISLLRLTRLELAGPATLAFLIRAPHGVPPSALLAVAGMLFHSIGCVVNDIADRGSDRYDPRRAARPLVAATVTVRAASVFAALLAVAFCAVSVLLWSGWWLVLSLGVLVLNVTGDAVRKHTLVPPLWDLAFGVDMAGCVLLGAGEVTGPTFAVALCFGLACTIFDTSAAGLKDLRWDLPAGVRTTATYLRCTADSTGRVGLSPAYRSWVAGLAVVEAAATAAAGLVCHASASWTWAVSAVAAMGCVLVLRGLRQTGSPVPHLVAGSAAFLVAVLVLGAGLGDVHRLAAGILISVFLPPVLTTSMTRPLRRQQSTRKA